LALVYIVIAGVLIASSSEVLTPPSGFDPIEAAGAMVASVIAYGFLAALTTRRFLRRVAAAGESRAAVRGYGRAIMLQRALLVAMYCVQVYCLAWPQVVFEGLKLRGWPLVHEVLVLLPFLVMLLLSWVQLHRIDQFVRHSEWPLAQYVVFQFRHYVAIVLVPWMLFVAAFDLIDSAGVGYRYDWPLAAGLGLLLYVMAPVLLRHMWHTESLPPCDMRTRLEAISRRADLTFHDILVWHTGGGRIANACIAGAWGKTRCVFLTDLLLYYLTPAEIEAVFAHEAGHVKCRHMLFYLWFGANYMLLHTAVEDFLSGYMTVAGARQIPILFCTAIMYWYFFFGFVSRRLERQADVYGAHLVGDASAMASSLDAITLINGSDRRRSSWRYFSVADRTEFLTRAEESPALLRRLRLELAGIHLVVLLTSIICAGYVFRHYLFG